MNLRWAPQAAADLEEAAAYARLQEAGWDQSLLRILSQGLDQLLEHPNSGRPGRLNGTRELSLPDLPYFVVYWVNADDLVVLRFYHAARRWPPAKPKSPKPKA